MKSRITLLSILSVMVAFAASAQNVEQDDMYFRSKDRAVLASTKPLTINANTVSRASEVNSPINPTDSYSARNVNPEYISQAKVNPSSTTLAETSTYFIPNYSPTTVNQNISNTPINTNYYSGGYSPSYYGMNSMMGYGMNSMMNYGMSGFGSPYYSPMGYYDPFGYNPYGYNNYGGGGFGYSPGLSFSMGMGFGGYNSYWGNSCYNPYYGGNVIVVNSGDLNGRNVVYAKRSSRSNDINNTVTGGNRSTTVDNSSQNAVRSSSGGRVASTSDSNAGSYYQRGWRTNPETNSRAAWNNSVNSSSNSFFNNSGNTGRNSNSDFSNNSSRSWSGNNSSNFSTGSRSSVSSSGGGTSSSSSGGAKRGRD
jgi:hypothetical protein